MIGWDKVGEALTGKVGEAFLTGAVAPGVLLLGQWILRKTRKPKLSLKVGRGRGFRVKRDVFRESGSSAVGGIWLRVRVANEGRSIAQSCSVFLRRYGVPGSKIKFINEQDFDMIPLRWSHSDNRPDTAKYVVNIPPRTHFYADFLLSIVTQDFSNFRFQTDSAPPDFSYLAETSRGLSVELVVVDAEGNSDSKYCSFTLDGDDDGLHWL